MAAPTVRKLDDAVYDGPQEQARPNQRSNEAEARVILPQGVRLGREAVLREAEAIRRSLVGRYTGDPTAEIREDRDSR